MKKLCRSSVTLERNSALMEQRVEFVIRENRDIAVGMREKLVRNVSRVEDIDICRLFSERSRPLFFRRSYISKLAIVAKHVL